MIKVLRIVTVINYVFCILFFYYTERFLDFYNSADFQSIYNILIGNINIFEIGFYPITSILIFSLFTPIFSTSYSLSLFFLISTIALFYINTYIYLSKEIYRDVKLNSRSILSIFFIMGIMNIFVFSSISFLMLKGSFALLFALSLIPYFLTLDMAKMGTIKELAVIFIILYLHPIALTLYLIIRILSLNSFPQAKTYFKSLFSLILTLSLALPIIATSFDLIDRPNFKQINYTNFNAFFQISLRIHSDEFILSLLIICLKLLILFFTTQYRDKFIYSLVFFIFPYLTYLAPYDNPFSVIFRLMSFPWLGNVYYFNLIYLFFPVIIFKKSKHLFT